MGNWGMGENETRLFEFTASCDLVQPPTVQKYVFPGIQIFQQARNNLLKI